MSSEITNLKRTRIEEYTISQNPNSLPRKLPQTIIYLISTYLNLKDARTMSKVCKNFRPLPSYYFRGALHTMQDALNRCLLTESHKAENCGLDAFSESWRKGFEHALPFLTEIDLHQEIIELAAKGSYFEQEYHAIPEKQLIHILNSGKSLQKLSLSHCTKKAVTLALTLNLTELNLRTTHGIDFSWFNKSLKKLSIDIYESDEENIHLFSNINNVDPLFPSLENFSLHTDKPFDKNFQTFLTRLPSLNTLTLLGKNTVIDTETIPLLKNLKNFTCESFTYHIKQLKNFYSLEILTVCCHGHLKHEESYELDKIIPLLKNLKKVNLDLPGVHWLPKITALDHVYVDFGSLGFDPHYGIYNLKHAKTRFSLCRQNFDIFDWDKLDFMGNFEEFIITFFNDSYSNDDIIQIESESMSIEEYNILYGLNILSKKITSIEENNCDFIWSKRIIAQLKNNPLIKCTRLQGRFHNENNKPIPTAELLALFPAVTEDKITREWEGRFSI